MGLPPHAPGVLPLQWDDAPGRRRDRRGAAVERRSALAAEERGDRGLKAFGRALLLRAPAVGRGRDAQPRRDEGGAATLGAEPARVAGG